jgi:ParB-like chromosome segregation protein Spo0J
VSKIFSVSPDRLVPNKWNSNVVSSENELKIDEAIKRFGFFKPIVVRELDGTDKFEIIGGEHRWESSVRLKLKEVPIFNLGIITDIRAKEISIADNARYGTDDSVALAEIMQDIKSEDITQFLPYSENDVMAIFKSIDLALDELEIDDELEEVVKKEPSTSKSIPTHNIMRFKISIADSERITALIEKTKKRFSFTSSDDLTNAGDALVHLLSNSNGEEDE